MARLVAVATALGLRRLRDGHGSRLAIAGIVLASAFAIGAAPRWLDARADTLLRDVLAAGSPADRSLEFASEARLDPKPADPLAAATARERSLADALPQSLAGLVVDRQIVVDTAEFLAAGAPRAITKVRLRIEPAVESRVRWIAGRAPTGATRRVPFEGRIGPGGSTLSGIEYEVALASGTADILRLSLGDRLEMAPDSPRTGERAGALAIVVVGLFDALDPDAAGWFGDTALLRPPEQRVSSEVSIWHAAALLAPGAYAVLAGPDAGSQPLSVAFRTRWRYLVAADRLPGSTLDATLADLARLRAAHPAGNAATAAAPALSTGLGDRLERHRAERTAAESLLAVVAFGPAAGAFGAILLASAALARRRRPVVRAERARGATAWQSAGAAALEALVAVVPAALAGGVLAMTVLPGPVGSTSFATALVAVAGAGLCLAAGLPAIRDPLRAADARTADGRPGSRAGFDLAVIGLALAAAGVLAGGGTAAGAITHGLGSVAGQGTRIGPDLAVVAAPVLVALAGAIALLRVLPGPVALAARVASLGRGAPAVIALRDAARRPRASAIPIAVLLVATATGTVSAAAWTSIGAGQEAAALERVGADARLESTTVNPLPGPLREPGAVNSPAVVATAAVARFAASVNTDRTVVPLRAQFIAPDLADLEAVAPATALRLGTDRLRGGPRGDGAIPVLLGEPLARLLPAGVGTVLTVNIGTAGRRFVVAGTLAAFPGAAADARFLVADRAAIRAADPAVPLDPSLVFLRGGDGVGDAARAAAARYGPAVAVLDRAAELAAIRASAFVPVVRDGILSTALVALLFAALVALASARASLEQNRHDRAILRAIGAGRREIARLVLVGQTGLVLAAAAGGVLVGLAMAALVVSGLDLGRFAGSAGALALHVEPGLVAAWAVVPGAIGIVAALAPGLWGGRQDLADAVRSFDA